MKLHKSVIFSDSKSALQALQKFPFKSCANYPVIVDCRKLLWECNLKGFDVIFAWIPSHVGISGNEFADKLANDAVDCGDIYPYKIFINDLLCLPNSDLRESWGQTWAISSQYKGKNYAQIQSVIPTKPWFYNFRFSKITTTIIIRMRLGHACTPSHLTRLGIVNNNMCDCGADVGNLNHIFFACSLNDCSSFIDFLTSLSIPLPTSINTLLCTMNYDIYLCISNFILKHNIKL